MTISVPVERNMSIGVAAVAVLLLGLSFWAGTQYGASSNNRGGFTGGQMQGARGASGQRFAPGGGFISGTISAKDAESVTVQMRQGGSRIILLGAKTEVTKSIAGTAEDLIVGKDVMAAGTQNPDGSISATTVQIRPAGMAGPGAGTPRSQQ